MPCDAILLTQALFVNEATLTGESMPIEKVSLATLDEISNERHWAYEGSLVLEKRGEPLALVVETGFNTRKGESFRRMMDD